MHEKMEDALMLVSPRHNPYSMEALYLLYFPIPAFGGSTSSTSLVSARFLDFDRIWSNSSVPLTLKMSSTFASN